MRTEREHASGPTARPSKAWPMGIVAAFAVFIAGLGTLITVAVSSRSDLVMEDYYEQELQYQTRIDQARRAQAWADQVEIRFDRTNRLVRIRLPQAHVLPDLAAELHLYRPSAARMDRTLPLHVNAEGTQWIGTSDLAPGRWKARIHWSVGGEEYFVERRLDIPGRGP